MSTSFLSPGVYSREIDFSLYVPNLSTTAVGCVGYATKGPINQPQYITNPVQFSTVFGDPSLSMTGPYAALQFLSMGRQLWYVRVAESNNDPNTKDLDPYLSTPATVVLKEASTKAEFIGFKTNIVSLDNTHKTLTFKVDGTSSGLDVVWTGATSATLVKSISDIANDLNADANFSAYFLASLAPTGALSIQRLVSGSNHGFVISGDALATVFGSTYTTTVSAWGTGTVAELASVLGNKPLAATTILAADTLDFVISDGNTTSSTIQTAFDAGNPKVFASASEVIDFLNASTTFTTNKLVASLEAGALKVSVQAASTVKLLALAGDPGATKAGYLLFGNINQAGFTAGNTTTPTLIITNSNNVLKFKLVATNGTFTNYTVTLTPNTYLSNATLFAHVNDRLVFATTDAGVVTDLSSALVASFSTTLLFTYTGAAKYVVFDPNSSAFSALLGQMPVEHYATTVSNNVLTATATSDGTWGNRLALVVSGVDAVNDTFNLAVYERGYLVERYEKLVKAPELLADGTDNPKFVEHAINSVSTRITITNDITTGQTLLPAANPQATSTSLAGGTDGVASITNPSTFIGVSDAVGSTGLQLFRNPERVDVNLLMVPGIASPPVINAMFDICTFRHDCMALVDPPFGLTPQEMVDWINGASGDHAAFNTSYAAVYWPWAQIYDPVNKKSVWTAPSGHISYVYAYTDYNAETWFAPAGLNRGHLSTPIKMEYVPTLGERDLLYQNNVNPIATFIRDGINVWGQKTLQRLPTALDRVNVRRLMLYLEKVVATAARGLVFEPSDRTTWIQMVNLIEPFLESVKSRRGVMEFKVVCDETTNTSDVIDRNEMNVRIYIRPTKSSEFIGIDFILTDSGTAFTELVF